MKKIYNYIKTLSFLAVLGATPLSAQVYCSSSAVSTYDDEIFNVTFGSLNNTSTCGQVAGGAGSVAYRYNNYTTVVPAPNLLMGNNYPLSVNGGQCNGSTYCGYIYVWIDYNQNGLFTDPGEMVYTSNYICWQPSGSISSAPNGITIPFTALPGVTRMRVVQAEGSTSGPCTTYGYGETEDYNVNIILPPPCSGVPGANAVLTPTYAICPNAAALLTLANSYTTYGFTYQWQSSTVSAVGPFVSIPNATMTTYVTPTLIANTYYQAVITCTNSNSSTITASGQVSIQPIVTSNIPYFEGFEGIINPNDLPNCSWAATNPTTQCRTYTSVQNQQRVARTGNKFASFFYSPSGTNHFFTNGIQMNAGVTYSASLWYATNYYGETNWSDMSILVGPNQSTTGLVSIVSSNGPAASTGYKSLTNTFTVATSGIYYVAIRGTSSGCCAYHLNWDDLLIEAPCALNKPSVTVNTSTNTICEGESVIMTASGANTYAWSHGPTTGPVTVFPTQSTLYTVVGTNTAAGCSFTTTQYINVLPKPNMAIFSDKQVVCAGKPVNISVSGASTYTWSTGSNSNFITVSPNTATTYSVIGSNAMGCTSEVVKAIGVNPLPVVTGTSDKPEICRGENATLTGGGAVSYDWSSSSSFIQAAVAVVSPNVNTTFTVTGTNANGCTNTALVQQNVQECLGVKEMTSLNGVKLYPNPTAGVFTVELNNGKNKVISVLDVTGRVILTVSDKNEAALVDISTLADGIYYVRIQSETTTDIIKLVKN